MAIIVLSLEIVHWQHKINVFHFLHLMYLLLINEINTALTENQNKQTNKQKNKWQKSRTVNNDNILSDVIIV